MVTAGLLLSLVCSSCQDEHLVDGKARVEEGLPATVTLKVKVNDMGVYSRSIIDEENANYCNNLWVGMYSKDTGKRLDAFYVSDVANTLETVGEYYTISRELLSANDVYIFGVANSDINTSIAKVGDYGGTEGSLRNMLDEADTLEKFKQLCVLRPDANDVNVYANTLTMSGWYSEKDATSHTDASNIPTVNIGPGYNELSGAIYLQRIIAYNKFTIKAGDYVNLTLNTWKVCNVPAGCSVLEQSGNVADNYTGSKSFYNESLSSRMFTTEADGGESFEFYQLENKHTGLDYAADGSDHVGINPSATSMYDEREREYKTTSNNIDTNTGIYRSLVKSDRSNLSNNNASYVVINATVDYYVAAEPADGSKYDPNTAEPIDPSSTVKKVHRTADVNYTIHLGYCEGKNSDETASLTTAKDFNCRRNSRYDYTVTINGVKNVVVEATKEDSPENQPGVDGWVNDDTGEYEKLDSHYCEFNIALTDEERKTMFYRITAPYGDKFYYYSRDKDGNVEMTEGMNKDLYSWIKFKPTTDKNTLAKYDGGKDLWTFNDMCQPTVKDNPSAPDADGNKWYTVFVDEYVYTFDDKGSKETSWPNYVNKDDRIAEFIIQTDKSKDMESSYSYNKYTFAQKSIQTYYKSDGENSTATGVEHFEETYCLNMNWNYLTGSCWNERNTDDYSYSNGRYNLYNYLTNKTDMKWASVIQETVPGHVNAGSNSGCSHPAADYPVYMPKAEAGAGTPSNAPSPGDGNTYYANSICMNRNRDLNGDGEITPDEIRWYTPTASRYIQIAIAQTELPNPIFRFTDYSKDYFLSTWTDGDNGDRLGTYNFHYITSDYLYYWAEQAVNIGTNPFSGYNAPASVANTVRCVRNLGTDPNLIPDRDNPGVGFAYTHDATNRTFTQDKFKDETLRGYNIGGIAPHDVSSPSARPYKKFEYAEHVCKNIKDSYISFNSSARLGFIAASSNPSLQTAAWTNSLRQNGICGQYTQETDRSDLGTWRIPSAYELALMWSEGLLQNTPTLESGYVTINETTAYFLSATHDYFISFKTKNYDTDNQVYIGYYDYNRQMLALDCLDHSGEILLRCVRDVKM
jgi:hypothetical protein